MPNSLHNKEENQIILNSLMRSLLCEAICSRLDIVVFFDTHLQIALTPDLSNANHYSSSCPWCGSALERPDLTFTVNIKTGRCSSCSLYDFQSIVGHEILTVT